MVDLYIRVHVYIIYIYNYIYITLYIYIYCKNIIGDTNHRDIRIFYQQLDNVLEKKS